MKRAMPLLAVLLVAGCGGSGQGASSKQACARAATGYQALVGALREVGQGGSAFGDLAAKADEYATDLRTLRPAATSGQRPQLQQAISVLSQVKASAQQANAGNVQQAVADLTGVAEEIGTVPRLVKAICHS